MKTKILWLLGVGLAIGLGTLITACTSGATTTPSGSVATVNPASLTCTQCHNDTTTVLAKELQWQQSVHFTGGDYVRATSGSCAGCHSSEGFTAMIAAGQNPGEVTQGQTNPTPPNCRTCHQVHTTYTSADFALRTTDPVTLYISGATFNFGEGNLCGNCHQPRMAGPTVGSGDVTVDSTHWGPHHGPQTASFLGIGGYNVQTTVSPHYLAVKNGCPTCHMVNATHNMTPDVSACQACHSGATSFDIDNVQSNVKALEDQLATALEAKGLLNNGSPVPGTYSEQEGGALWNYVSAMEDRSFGVHNPTYIQGMLQAGLDALK